MRPSCRQRLIYLRDRHNIKSADVLLGSGSYRFKTIAAVKNPSTPSRGQVHFAIYSFRNMANYNPYFPYQYSFYNSAQLPYQQQQPLSQDQLSQRHQETPRTSRTVDPLSPEESYEISQYQSQTSKGKSTSCERWQFKDEQVLIQLWADNIDKLESKDSRKVWEQIARTLNEKGVNKTVDQCQRKIKHLKNQYKDKKDWNRR